MAVPRRDFFAQSLRPAAPTQIDENEHDGPHVCCESQVVITTNTCPVDSRALGVGWVAWFGFPCYGPALRIGRTKTKREVALVRSPRPACCILACSWRIRHTSGCLWPGGGGAENRNAPNDTAALSFVESSEAARYVFVVVVIGDVMIAGRRYRTFVLACRAAAVRLYSSPMSVGGAGFARLAVTRKFVVGLFCGGAFHDAAFPRRASTCHHSSSESNMMTRRSSAARRRRTRHRPSSGSGKP